MYYLQSRYYNPTLGRFLSSDIVYDTDAGLQGFNLFLYCGNNPTNRIDASGADSNELSNGEDMLDKALLEGGGGKGGGASPGSSGGQSNSGFNILSEIVCLLDMLGQTMSDAIGGLMGSYRTTPYTPVCFVEGTLIHAHDSLVPIEQIRVGDLVWAWDEETGAVALKEVVETYVNESAELVHIFVNGEEISTKSWKHL